MREILFRGKRADNGEWVEGYLYITQNGQYEISNYCKYYAWERYTYIVIPETVGQYTGLKDKNGTKIFEGDIIKIGNKTRYVFWGVCGYRHTNYGEYSIDLSVKDGDNCEVIGNFHDNPELLEVGK